MKQSVTQIMPLISIIVPLYNVEDYLRPCLDSISAQTFRDFVNVPCDYLVLGSDQIWSTWITGGPDPVFYGKGEYKGLKKRISYAASSEMSTFNNPNYVKIIGEYLQSLIKTVPEFKKYEIHYIAFGTSGLKNAIRQKAS